jgi:hypothetical protein
MTIPLAKAEHATIKREHVELLHIVKMLGTELSTSKEGKRGFY